MQPSLILHDRLWILFAPVTRGSEQWCKSKSTCIHSFPIFHFNLFFFVYSPSLSYSVYLFIFRQLTDSLYTRSNFPSRSPLRTVYAVSFLASPTRLRKFAKIADCVDQQVSGRQVPEGKRKKDTNRHLEPDKYAVALEKSILSSLLFLICFNHYNNYCVLSHLLFYPVPHCVLHTILNCRCAC